MKKCKEYMQMAYSLFYSAIGHLRQKVHGNDVSKQLNI